MARLVVVGLPGVGKSTLAVALAAHWDCAAVDTDELIAQRVDVPAASYLVEHGETAFREIELEALRDALASDAVVATGAGVVTLPAARSLLATSDVLWLDCADATLLERVRDGERPLLGEDHAASLRTLRARRQDWYHEVASTRVDADGSVDDVLARVLSALAST